MKVHIESWIMLENNIGKNILKKMQKYFMQMAEIYLNGKITQKILTSKEPGFGIDEISLNANTRIVFDQEKGNFSIFVSSGKERLYTEGLEYVYQYSSYPYHGYYNIDERNTIWTGAYKSNTSISLREMTQDEIEEWSDTSS